MKVLITGAKGFVGRHLVATLADAGHAAVRLSRGVAGPPDRHSFEGPADLADIERFPAWPEGIDAVVHLAALNPARGDPAGRDPAALAHANVAATAALARRAALEGVRRMVFIGSAGVHAPAAADGPVAETAPLAPRSPYAVSKAQAETAFRDALAGSATKACVLRPAPVFGPGARNLTAALVGLAHLPFPLPLGGFGRPRSLVGVDSLAEVIVLCLTSDAAAGKTFLVADDEALTPAGIVAALREGRGRRPAILPAPTALAGFAARLAGRQETWAAAVEGLVVDTRHIRQSLGWHPPAAGDVLREMAAQGRL